jgi:hypothetical protein
MRILRAISIALLLSLSLIFSFGCGEGNNSSDVFGWSTVGTTYAPGAIQALYYNSHLNTLYAGGTFSSSGGIPMNCAAKWNGTSWEALGDGLENAVLTFNSDHASGMLYAGGDFTAAEGKAVGYLAQWDGISWEAVPSGSADARVNTLSIDQNRHVLYVGGDFHTIGALNCLGIAQYSINDNIWSSLGGELDGYVKDSVYSTVSDVLYVAGNFEVCPPSISASRVAKWDGFEWTSLEAGMDATVYALALDGNDNLYAGGEFTTAGGRPAFRCAKWNGSVWSAVGSIDADVISKLVYNRSTGTLWAAAQKGSDYFVAIWNGSTWSTTLEDSAIYTIAGNPSRNEIFAGGYQSGGIVLKWSKQ